ncbi:hypothetical protein NKH18_17560 [Streptomyces sp. M10(2022)]
MNDDRTDAGDLAEYGYQQELKRTLSTWAVFAIGFATISPSSASTPLSSSGSSSRAPCGSGRSSPRSSAS